jgi:hypothetical protein
MGVRWSLSVVLALCLWTPAAAYAQGAADGDYRSLVREALAEYAAGNFLEARTLFERAHALRPSARTLRGLGLVAYELKHYVQAIRELHAALASDANPLTAAQTQEARAAVEKASRFVGTLVLSAKPVHAELRIDGQRVARGEHGLDAGDHRVAAEAKGHRSVEQTVTLRGGQRLETVLVLPARDLGLVSAPAPGAARGAQEPHPARDDAGGGGSAAPWLLIGGAAVAIAGGVVLGLALAAKADVESIEDGEKSWSDVRGDVDAVPVQSWIGGVAIGVGAAAGAVGIVWMLSDDGEEPVRVTLRGTGARLEGAF